MFEKQIEQIWMEASIYSEDILPIEEWEDQSYIKKEVDKIFYGEEDDEDSNYYSQQDYLNACDKTEKIIRDNLVAALVSNSVYIRKWAQLLIEKDNGSKTNNKSVS